jgi:ribosomal protein L29
MKYKELASMDKEERDKKMKELELEIIKLNSQVHTGTPPKNSGQLKKMKKDMARIMLINSTDKELKSRTTKKTPKTK